MYLEELKKILRQEHILEKYQIDELCIFGSIARGENGNDIDLLVNDDNYKKWIEIKAELEKKTGIKVDIMLEKYANPIVLYRANREKIYVGKYS
ncbi:MAG: nucleotidyltransferase domain-containing protein [Psychrilyobacter sp.]|uniref:nucleotidyltransferase family protein n=1 Tax=Psychrilyobacter sp. TaxID=2586924 RepID=UPI003C71B86D